MASGFLLLIRGWGYLSSALWGSACGSQPVSPRPSGQLSWRRIVPLINVSKVKSRFGPKSVTKWGADIDNGDFFCRVFNQSTRSNHPHQVTVSSWTQRYTQHSSCFDLSALLSQTPCITRHRQTSAASPPPSNFQITTLIRPILVPSSVWGRTRVRNYAHARWFSRSPYCRLPSRLHITCPVTQQSQEEDCEETAITSRAFVAQAGLSVLNGNVQDADTQRTQQTDSRCVNMLVAYT